VIPRVLLGFFLAVVMVVVGVSSYLVLDARKSKVALAPQKPTAAQPTPHAFVLPGTIYLTQNGALYSFSSGRFHQLTGESGWMQPSLTPDGNLLIVKRSGFFSDVYELNRFGTVTRQVTSNAAPRRSFDTADNHWSFYPRLTPDGKTLFMSYDKPKSGYEVDMSIWSMPLGSTIARGQVWSDEPADQGYTGGDMQPIPVPGGIIYTKYYRNPDGTIVGQLWFTNRAGSLGKALTTPVEDCRDPSLAPAGNYLAMVCTYGKQISNLMIAPLAGGTLGARKAIITDQMVAQPTWAPDGSGIAYLAPALPDSPFQLYFISSLAYFPPAPSPVPTPSVIPGGPQGSPEPSSSASPVPTPAPVKAVQMTVSLGFDATSTLAWAP
jgi:WD40-like Beta Propeller Repeat